MKFIKKRIAFKRNAITEIIKSLHVVNQMTEIGIGRIIEEIQEMVQEHYVVLDQGIQNHQEETHVHQDDIIEDGHQEEIESGIIEEVQ